MAFPSGMNTKILLAIVGVVALSACGKNKTPKPVGWEFPLVEPKRTAVNRHGPAVPPAFNRGHDPFRQPDVTEQLPNSRNRPVPASSLDPIPRGPLSSTPLTPPPTPLAAPEEEAGE